MANKQIVVKLGADTSDIKTAMQGVKTSTKTATDGLKRGFDETGNSSSKAGGMIKNAFSGIAGILAGAFAVGKIVDFGKNVIEASATAQVMNAQFAQAFKGIEGVGNEMLENLSSNFNILPERLKTPMNAFQSYFKGAGASAMESAEMTETAMTLAGDSAAYYDKSLEDTSASLKGFLMGNYENGDQIGVNTNATKIATAYNGKYGGSFEDLSDAQKQNYLLEYIEDIYKLNGAMGQGEREAHGYENVMGNLKQSWQNFMAGLGEAALPIAIGLMEKLGNWINNIDTEALVNGFMSVGGYLKDVLTPVFDTVIDYVGRLWDKFKEAGGIEGAKGVLEGIKTALAWFKDNGDIVASAIIGVTTAIAVFNTLTAISATVSAFSKVMDLFKAGQYGAMLAQMGLNTALLANPFTWVAIGIGALIAVIVLLWKNWDTVSAFLTASWETIKSVASATFTWLGEFFGTIWEGIKTGAIAKWEEIKVWLATSWESIKEGGINTFNQFKDAFIAIWEGIKAFIAVVWEGIKAVFMFAVTLIVTLVVNYFTNLKNNIVTIFNLVKSIITTVWAGIKNVFTTVVSGIVTFVVNTFNVLKNGVTTTFNLLKTIIATIWNGIKTAITMTVNIIKTVITTVFNAVKSVITTIFNGIKTFITTVWNGIKTTVSTAVNSVKSTVTNTFNSLKSSVTTVWNGIKNAIKTPIESAKNAVKTAIDKIKGFMDFKWSLPSLKMPKFSITGKFGLNPPSIPKLGLSWHANGGIVKGTQGGTVVGMGENGGDEAILPLSNKGRMKPFAHAVASMMPDNGSNNSDGGGDTIITGNTFHVREEADIKKVAQELYKLEQRKRRAKGKGGD